MSRFRRYTENGAIVLLSTALGLLHAYLLVEGYVLLVALMDIAFDQLALQNTRWYDAHTHRGP